MLSRLAPFVYHIMMEIKAFLERRYLRKLEKTLFLLHTDSWKPLTNEELRSIDRKDKYAYSVFKNMAGTENLPYYVSASRYKTVLLPLLNPLNHTPSGEIHDSCFADKNYAELIMGGVQFPRTILRCMSGQLYNADLRRITVDEALTLTEPYSELVFKHSVDSGHGTGVKLLSSAEIPDAITSYSKNYVVQERVHQHPVLSYFNESSVNIIRITSVWLDGEVYLLGGILRIGAPGSFCDHTPHGGTHNLDVGINEDGTLMPIAFDPDHCYVYNTVYGKEIRARIPKYEEIKALIIQEHAKYPRYALIGWDFTVDAEENIICMEFNTKWPGISATQYAHGPVFAKKTKNGVPLLDAILEGKQSH